MTTTYGPDFNGVVHSVSDRSSAEPENQAEALDRELSRLIGEYMDDDASDSTKAEAWNMIADFTVENAKTIIAALAALPEAPAVPVVKALEWQEIHQRRSDEDPTTEVVGWEAEANGFACSYIVELTGGGASMRDPDYEEKQFDDPDAAKAAAQADFEARIRSSLQSSPPVNAAPDRAMLERAHDWMADNIREADIEGATILGYLANYLNDAPVKAAAVDGDWRDKRIAVLEASWQKCAEQLHEVAQERNALEEKLAALASQPAGEGEAVAYVDVTGNVSIPEGSPLGDMVRALPKPPVGKACLPLYASPRPAAADTGVRDALKDIVEFCDDPEGSEKPESLGMGLARLLPAARTALSLAAKREQARMSDLIERLKKCALGSADEDVMVRWHKIRAILKQDKGGTWPRECFESIIDGYAEDCDDAVKEIASLRTALSQEREERDEWQRRAERAENALPGEVERRAQADYVTGLEASIASLEAERDDARRQRDEIGRAWDEADARAKEAEALAARMEKALAEARAQRDYWRGRDKAGCEIEAELRAELERIASPGTIAGMHEQDRAAKLQAIAAASLSSSKQKDDE